MVKTSFDCELNNSPLWCAASLLSQDLKDLDEDTLRFRVAQLATEIQERTKWEALRLMEGVQKKEAEIAQKVGTLRIRTTSAKWRLSNILLRSGFCSVVIGTRHYRWDLWGVRVSWTGTCGHTVPPRGTVISSKSRS